ncbi:hypothetical protein [Hymenobacter sp.]|uniref:hypothetical protein n=1 Tax=Hymenobacter sp. TaxID=1898978 RepID=UPI002ED9543C
MASLSSQAQWKLVNADCAFPANIKYFNTVADDQPVSNTDLNKRSPSADKKPRPLLHAAEVAEAEYDYEAGKYAEAAAHLKPFVGEKLVSPKLLSLYARSLYRVPDGKDQSYAAYQRLIEMLDTYGREDAATCAIYLNFSESYYKLATMQMDKGQWKLAAYNLSRFLFTLNAVPSWKTDDIYQSALEYQTECFSELGDLVLTRHYGQRTLKFFPQNQYVLSYMSRLPEPVKAKPQATPKK